MGEVVEFERISQEQMHVDLGEVFRGAIRMSLEMLLEDEVKAMVGVRRYERSAGRQGHRNGSYLRGLLTSLGHIEVRVPRTRDGSAAGVIGEYQRRSPEVDAVMTEAYVSGVSQRKMADVTESLLGQRVSRSTTSRVAKRLQQTVEDLRTAKLEQNFRYLYLDATFIDARWARRVENVSALVAYGVGEDGYRHLLSVHIGPQESETTWSEVLEQLVARGLRGVVLVISDDHAGLKAAVRHWLPDAAHQRCTVHVQRNVIAKVPRRLHKRVAGEVGEIFKAPDKKQAAARRDEFAARWSKELPEAVDCLSNAFASATRFYDFPEEHWQRIHTTNSIERLNGEIKRRTRAVGAFPDRASALRLITAVAIKTCAQWGDKRYLKIQPTKEEIKKVA